jgi:hypothetical protein
MGAAADAVRLRTPRSSIATPAGTFGSMGAQAGTGGARDAPLERHPSLDERFDPAVRIVDYDLS